MCLIEKAGKLVEVGPFPVCLPMDYADRNLLETIREAALARFHKHGIAWHMGVPTIEGTDWPSSHLLDSQVQCVNVLLELAADPAAILSLARRLEPESVDCLPIEDGSPVAFEVIGDEDYLGEGRGRARQRGKYATSADAMLIALRKDGGRTGILIEWKFTETYDKPISTHGPGGTDRREVYRAAYEGATSPFAIRPEIDVFLQEPHYQLFRLALLAGAMVEAHEHRIDRAVLAHLIPKQNVELRNTVPLDIRPLGDTVEAIWHQLLPGPIVQYASIDTMPLLTSTTTLAERYGRLGPTSRR
jgi:hypothetical protein